MFRDIIANDFKYFTVQTRSRTHYSYHTETFIYYIRSQYFSPVHLKLLCGFYSRYIMAFIRLLVSNLWQAKNFFIHI